VNFFAVSFSMGEHKQDIIDLAIQEKINLAETISKAIALPQDQGSLADLIQKMVNFQDTRFIRVVDQNGNITQSSIEGEINQIISDPVVPYVLSANKEVVRHDSFNHEDIKVVIYPATNNTTIWIGFTLDSVEQTIQSIWFKDALTLLTVICFSIIVLLIILRDIIHPLSEVTFACEKIRKGNFNVKIPASSRTEIGEFVETFNSTMAELRQSQNFLKRARERTEEEKNKTMAIINNSPDGLIVFDENKRIALLNPRAENFLGIGITDVKGKALPELVKYEGFKKIATIVHKEVKNVFREELAITPHLLLEISAIPVLKNQKKAGTLVILHNITREKRVERMKTEFVSIAAHQLRTPLSAIKWTLKMFTDGDFGKITPKQKEFMEKIYKSNERMITLINDLLNVARVEEGRYIYKKSFTDIGKTCEDVVQLYKEELERKDIKFNFIKPNVLPGIMVDEEKVRMAFRNIFENAIKYTPRGNEITASIKNFDDELEISISDTGVGIPESQQDRIFSKFFRGGNIMRMETQGTGLGLFIAKNIIEAHKGRIWFESKENKGTTFYFTLPL
jgi:two-component system sensor histidine kinase VicK